jgi:hypothetical protein
MERKSFNIKFCSWFTGTCYYEVKHPYYGRNQLTPYQIKYSTGEYKNKLFKNIKDCFDEGHLTKKDYEKHSIFQKIS